MSERKRILVLCTGNRCRSQMAEGWLRHFGGDWFDVRSAGTQPKGVHPLAIKVMREAGVDIGGQASEHVDKFRDQRFDVVVTVCDAAREACPVFPNAGRTVHRSFDDPDKATGSPEQVLDVFRRVRDEVRDWAKDFVAEVLKEPAAGERG
ncbi:MAG: arsenate reductase ArsC [Phycisphaeraceae bacterium]